MLSKPNRNQDPFYLKKKNIEIKIEKLALRCKGNYKQMMLVNNHFSKENKNTSGSLATKSTVFRQNKKLNYSTHRCLYVKQNLIPRSGGVNHHRWHTTGVEIRGSLTDHSWHGTPLLWSTDIWDVPQIIKEVLFVLITPITAIRSVITATSMML